MRKHHPIALAAAGALSLAAAAPATAAPGTGLTGPTTTVPPYVLPSADGVQTTSLLTVGDLPAGNGYRMVGIPDGLGARRRAGGAVELFMTHELRGAVAADPFQTPPVAATPAQGIPRAHGQAGSFISNYRIDAGTLAVTEGRDLIDSPSDVSYWNYPAATTSATPSPAGANPLFFAQNASFNRFCSATLSDPGALYNADTLNGYRGQVFFGNEEAGNEARVFGTLDDGTTRQLERLGLFTRENTIPAPNQTDTTLVMGQEDAGSAANPEAQIWTYVGQKQSTGDAFDKAGLTNGTNHVFDDVDPAVTNEREFRAKYAKNTPSEVRLTEVDWNQNGAAQNTEARNDGLALSRIEDGYWDPSSPRDFYFLTTEGGNTTVAPNTTNSRDGGGLWRLRYRDIENPSRGATLTLLLDGSEAPFLNKPDNMVIDTHRNLLIQEDPGNNASLARIVAYEISTGRRGVLATFDAAKFGPLTPGGTNAPVTADEESSGILDGKETFGDGSFIFDAQVHKARPEPELVEEGQLMLLEVDDFSRVYPAVARPKVTCKLSRNRRSISCKVTFSRSAKASRVRLVRLGRTVARGRMVKGTATLSGRRIAKGSYTLVAAGRSTRLSIR